MWTNNETLSETFEMINISSEIEDEPQTEERVTAVSIQQAKHALKTVRNVVGF